MLETFVFPLRMTAAMGLLVLPGSWIAFGRAGTGNSFAVRLALAVVLSPLVVVLEFYTARGVGLPFAAVAITLAMVNAPALLLMVRSFHTGEMPRWRSVATWLLFISLPAAYLSKWLADVQVRANWGHAWNHADIVYQLASGRLRPEEPLLAGVRLAYPWLGHVFEGVVAFVADRPPNSFYLLINLAWLAATFVFVAAIVSRLGGGGLAQASASAWLCFGVNFCGTVGARVIPSVFAVDASFLGDARYTPWLRKFGIFEQSPLGIALFAAVLFLLSASARERRGGASPWILLSCLLSAGLFYPVLFPASLAVVMGRALVIHSFRSFRDQRGSGAPWRETGEFALAAGVSALATAGYLRLVLVDRVTGLGLGLSDGSRIWVKLVALIVALMPALLALALDVRSVWRQAPATTALLLFGAASSAVVNLLADIRYDANEYKYVFTAAMCLAPFPAVALDRLLRRFGRMAMPLTLAVTAGLAWPAVADVGRRGPSVSPVPRLGAAGFSLSLADDEPMAGVLSAVRLQAPRDAVVISRVTTFDLATVTQRAVYVPASSGLIHGIGLPVDYLLERFRGYSPDCVDSRRERMRVLFGDNGDTSRQRAVREIVDELHRSAVLIVRPKDDTALVRWLSTSTQARRLYEDSEYSAWVVGR